jgi:hypothetical protein
MCEHDIYEISKALLQIAHGYLREHVNMLEANGMCQSAEACEIMLLQLGNAMERQDEHDEVVAPQTEGLMN